MEQQRPPVEIPRCNDRKKWRKIQKRKRKRNILNITNIWTIRRYYNRLKIEFIIVMLIYSYVYTCSYFVKKGECGMTSLHAILYMYTINGSSDKLVPVNNATTQHCAELFINL